MKLTVDFNQISNLDEFHEYISKELNFGEEYGCNLDALHDEISSYDDLDVTVIKGGQVQMEMQELIEDILTGKVEL